MHNGFVWNITTGAPGIAQWIMSDEDVDVENSFTSSSGSEYLPSESDSSDDSGIV